MENSQSGGIEEIFQPKSICPKPGCQKCQGEVMELMEKRTLLLKKLDKISKELIQWTEELEEVEETEKQVAADYASLESKLLKLKMMRQEVNLSDKLVLVRNEGLELRRQIDLSLIEAKKLRSKVTYFLPSMAVSKSQADPSPTVKFQRNIETNEKCQRVHTGIYKRSARTNWELAWSCCMNASQNSMGCSVFSGIVCKYPSGKTLSKSYQSQSLPASHFFQKGNRPKSAQLPRTS